MPEQQIAAEHKPYMKLQEKEYIIIKYPQGTRFWQLPRELRFRLDEKSLVSLECLLSSSFQVQPILIVAHRVARSADSQNT